MPPNVTEPGDTLWFLAFICLHSRGRESKEIITHKKISTVKFKCYEEKNKIKPEINSRKGGPNLGKYSQERPAWECLNKYEK